MGYLQLTYFHLSTILPAFLIGTYLLASRKGTSVHRGLGRAYMLLMLCTSAITLFMTAEVGPTFLGHFGYIHLLSFLVLYCVPAAWFAARRGDLRAHKFNMIGLYVGGLLIAGGFTLMPGRLLHEWLLGG
jgi:uncharacterized membrane protein